jgi:aldehyde:ferredoxin oxidoreductase
MPANKDGRKCFISHSMFGSNGFGIMMKNAGYDHIVIIGRAKKPCYLKVTDKDMEICDAAEIWGKDVYEAGRILRENIRGKNRACGTWVIGQAGENLVRPSLGWADDWHNAGRSAGAVAGAKNLKAVVTLGEKGVKIANGERFVDPVNEIRQLIRDQIAKVSGSLPWTTEEDKLLEETKIRCRTACSGSGALQTFCYVCRRVHKVKEGPYEGEWWGGTYGGVPKWFSDGFKLKEYFTNYGEAFKIHYIQ